MPSRSSAQVHVLAYQLRRVAIGRQVAVFPSTRLRQVGLKVVSLAVELMFIHAHQPDQ